MDDNPVPEVVRGSVKWRTLLEQTLARGGPTLLHKEAIDVNGDVHHHDILPYIYDGGQALPSAEYYPLVQQLGMAESYDRQMLLQIIPLLRHFLQRNWPFRLVLTHYCSAVFNVGCAILCFRMKKRSVSAFSLN